MELRALTIDDAPAAYRATATALLLPSFTPSQLERRLAAWPSGYSWGAFEEGRLVGHARALELETTVPGGARLPTAGVTSVGVLPTHTRRGVLRSMLGGLLGDARGRGAVLASLRASEGAIYGRFGFGLAGLCATYELDGGSGLRADAGAAAHRVRLLEPHEVRATVPPLHERIATSHVGAVGRLEHWWDNSLSEFDDAARSLTRWVAVTVDEHGRADGYVDAALEDRALPSGAVPGRRLVVGDLFAGSDGAYRALWRHVLGVDLVGTIVAPRRPTDERLRWMLEDPRALRTLEVADDQWLRLLDVEAALAARQYAAVGASVVLEVRDEQYPTNAGRFRVGPERAARTTDAADVALDVAELGALYLGGVRATDLAAVGRLELRRAGAASALDALLAVGAAPWCGSFF